MKTYIELWKAKQAWHDMSMENRVEYMSQVGPAIEQLIAKGLEVVSWGVVEPETHKRVDYDFFGIWKVPSVGLAREFEALVEAAGWHNFFEQVNAMGDHDSPEGVIGRLINL